MVLASQAESVTANVAAEAPINTEVSNIAETKLGRELNDLPRGTRVSCSGLDQRVYHFDHATSVEIDNSDQISVARSTVDMRPSAWMGSAR
jgi:hypothetical protein